jgi:hypothetical protein
VTHLCGYLTDANDCGAGTISSLNAEAYSGSPALPFPRPPPPPAGASPPPPQTEIFACNQDSPCNADIDYCSDGGLNSHPIGHDAATGKALFACTPGTQCSETLCRPRIVTELVICSDSCLSNRTQGSVLWFGRSRNGVCEDGGEVRSFVDVDQSGVFQGLNYSRIGGCGFGTGTLFT